ncbi:hypothetical protein HMPREF9429_00295 [Megasphaera micronuciformis F0359]|uniref:Uncharacterized protein n=1 Tax=Megasphaera micronuciformis F0359 TaxID=706434 RepID=E2ZA36_9FIRM|nr:hypothetical protein HMPREF9429_00295 [Megasphaera micronuciformis F0359]
MFLKSRHFGAGFFCENIMGILERELGRNERYDVKIFVETDYL